MSVGRLMVGKDRTVSKTFLMSPIRNSPVGAGLSLHLGSDWSHGRIYNNSDNEGELGHGLKTG